MTAVSFDAAGDGASSTNSTANLSWSHTASGSNRAVLVAFNIGRSPNGSYSADGWTRTVTYGGVSMSSLGVRNSNDGSAGFVEIFGLLNPPTGAQTVVASIPSAPATPQSFICQSFSYTGVGSFATAVTGISDGVAAPSLVVSSATGNRAFAAFTSGDSISTPTQTQRYLNNLSTATAAGNLLVQDAAGAASVTFGAADNNDWWGLVGVDLVAVPAVTRLGKGAGGSGTTSATWNSFNITSSDANTIAVVLVNASVSSNATPTCSVTYGGTTMKQLGWVAVGSSTSRAGAGIYYLFNPPTGVKSIVATPAGATIAATRGIDVACSGVSSIGHAQSVATMAHTVNSCTDGLALRVLSNGVTTGTLGGPAGTTTELQAGSSVSGVGDFIAVQSAPGAATVAFTASGTASTPDSVGCNLTPAGAMNMVQVASSASATASSRTLVMPGPHKVGNTIVVCARANPGANAVSTVSDSAGNSYSVACPLNRNGTSVVTWVYYAPITVASDAGTNTITVAWAGSQTSAEIIGVEYDGLDATAPFDQHHENTGTSTSFDSGNTPTTAQARGLVFGFGTTAGTTSAAGAGFTGRIVGTDAASSLVEDKVVDTTGTYNTTGTTSSAAWAMNVATFNKLIPGTTVTPSGASLAVTGSAAKLDATLSPSGSSSTLSGAAPSLNLALQPAAATLTVTGAAPQIATSTAPAGASLTLTGQTPTLITPQTVTPAAATPALTGSAPTVTVGVNVAPGSAALTLTGQTPTIVAPQLVTPTGAGLSLTGSAPTLDNSVHPAAASLTFTGSAPPLATKITPSAVSATLTGQTATLITPQTVTPNAATLTLTGSAPVVGGAISIAPAAATLTLTGAAPTIIAPQLARPTAAALALTGSAPRLDTTLKPAAATLTLTGATPTIIAPQLVTPTAATLSLTGSAPTIGGNQVFTPAAATATLTGATPTLIQPQTVTPAASALALTGSVPTVAVSDNHAVAPTAGNMALTGGQPNVIIPLIIIPAPNTLALTGSTPDVISMSPIGDGITLDAPQFSYSFDTPSGTYAFDAPTRVPNVDTSSGTYTFDTPTSGTKVN